jgi:cell division protein FtsL
MESDYHNSAQPYFRSRPNSRFLQQYSKQKVYSLSGDRNLWLAVGKPLLVFCPLFLAMNLWLASCFNNLEQSVQAVENVRHELMDRQINLRAKKDQLSSPERVRKIAEEKLSLYVPEKEQVMLF